jgi:hypothetical protein
MEELITLACMSHYTAQRRLDPSALIASTLLQARPLPKKHHGFRGNGPPGTAAVGRFGWKDQASSLLTFSGDAYLNEMGITSDLFPDEPAGNGQLCDIVQDPEDTGPVGERDIDLFAASCGRRKFRPAMLSSRRLPKQRQGNGSLN